MFRVQDVITLDAQTTRTYLGLSLSPPPKKKGSTPEKDTHDDDDDGG